MASQNTHLRKSTTSPLQKKGKHGRHGAKKKAKHSDPSGADGYDSDHFLKQSRSKDAANT